MREKHSRETVLFAQRRCIFKTRMHHAHMKFEKQKCGRLPSLNRPPLDLLFLPTFLDTYRCKAHEKGYSMSKERNPRASSRADDDPSSSPVTARRTRSPLAPVQVHDDRLVSAARTDPSTHAAAAVSRLQTFRKSVVRVQTANSILNHIRKHAGTVASFDSLLDFMLYSNSICITFPKQNRTPMQYCREDGTVCFTLTASETKPHVNAILQGRWY